MITGLGRRGWLNQGPTRGGTGREREVVEEKKREERGVERQGERVGGGEQRKVQYVIIDRGGRMSTDWRPLSS